MLYLPDYLALIASLLIIVLLAAGMYNPRRWLQATCYSITTLIFIAHVFHSRLEYLWVFIFPVPAVVIVKLIMGWGAGIALLLGLSKHVKRSSDRRLLRVIAGLLAGLLCWVFANHLLPPAVNPEACWYQDTMIQSTRNTCMAAAACTYLRTIKVDSSELAASRRGLISRYGGSETHAWRTLMLSLPATEYRVHIARLTCRMMADSGHWYIGSVQLNWLLSHGVAFRVESDGATVTVRDPMEGQYTQPWAEFERRWWGVGVWAEPLDKAESQGGNRHEPVGI